VTSTFTYTHTEVPRCEGCAYWHKIGWSEDSGKEKGNCLRYPPTIVSLLSHGSPVTRYPETTADSWCGEHIDRKMLDKELARRAADDLIKTEAELSGR
jgi:hypothetical protein